MWTPPLINVCCAGVVVLALALRVPGLLKICGVKQLGFDSCSFSDEAESGLVVLIRVWVLVRATASLEVEGGGDLVRAGSISTRFVPRCCPVIALVVLHHVPLISVIAILSEPWFEPVAHRRRSHGLRVGPFGKESANRTTSASELSLEPKRLTIDRTRVPLGQDPERLGVPTFLGARPRCLPVGASSGGLGSGE